jgi:hypothetical protein
MNGSNNLNGFSWTMALLVTVLLTVVYCK